ncbi:hypothetical protein RDABS01_023821 [Bienertia sinuspersici]
MLLILLCSCSLISLVKSCTASDRAALLAVKSALNEPYLGIFKSWTGDDCCTNWYGVNCNPDSGRVTKPQSPRRVSGSNLPEVWPYLRLHDGLNQPRNLQARFSDEPRYCRLEGNLRARFPPAFPIPSYSSTSSSSWGNRLTGHIPANIGKFQKLKVLNFADNVLTGEIPTSVTNLGGSLMHLDLRKPANWNNPSSITTMARLADLDLSTNKLTGSIPDQMGKMTVLSVLNLDSNDLSGYYTRFSAE